MDSASVDNCIPLLSMTGIHKWFGGVHALSGARMVLEEPGVVHALLGQNGSGKSTMLNILSGQLHADEGIVTMDGHEVAFRSPPDALERGISMVSQETALAEDLSVAENILLGRRLVRRVTGINWAATRARAEEVLSLLEVDYDPSRLVRSLRPDQKQMVEIARALSTDVKILILDEPTSSLTDEEVEALFAAIRRLKARGVSILYVSHRLPEVFEISDELTILRDGVTVAEGAIGDFSPGSVVRSMVGSEKMLAARKSGTVNISGTPLLQIENLCAAPFLNSVSIDVHEGEIVGLAGLLGSGRRELLETVYGLRTYESGSISLEGSPYRPMKPREAIKRRVGFVPPDRKTEGIVLPMPVKDNLGMAATCETGRLRNPDGGTIRSESAGIAKALSIKAALGAPAWTLSGGNQQKVVLGKWLVRPPRLLLLDEPTRGVDVAAKAEIHRYLRDAASRGTALLVSSSEYDELYELCDRIVVFFGGGVVADMPRQEASETRIAALAGGAAE